LRKKSKTSLELAQEHWDWLEEVLDKQREMEKKLFLDAFVHGSKHKEDEECPTCKGMGIKPDMTREEAAEIVRKAAGRRPDFPSGKDFLDKVRHKYLHPERKNEVESDIELWSHENIFEYLEGLVAAGCAKNDGAVMPSEFLERYIPGPHQLAVDLEWVTVSPKLKIKLTPTGRYVWLNLSQSE